MLYVVAYTERKVQALLVILLLFLQIILLYHVLKFDLLFLELEQRTVHRVNINLHRD